MDILLAVFTLILAIIALALVVTLDRKHPRPTLWWIMIGLAIEIAAGLWLLFLLIFT